ncbi:histidine phosphatase family protein [Lysinibacillus pakistanensis]|uniref:Histidine phosphatase family protein n=1 Tax=Lysinibacillus pakistanensis TaxID=759811 RepID=A0AAX3WSI2_9BACI|nr:histidine phosphatase family protein [Lysinibacillus pakistanensis]MDM5234322.1 histidine phosphatase family protein [Lysinibacillus pakistanensis]WHY44911.1 histidine phosphatase family protein [Lysinibacillus pakistanensis]WHY49918.1 histidine phosphatase family protein [Lysinibacillus pakistanensis]
MKKKIYIVRHCEAQGQPPESPLTEMGFTQAKYLSDFLSNIKIDRIISSPFLRAIQSVEPISKETNIRIEIDERLSERILSTLDLPDWPEKLKATFDDSELKFEGGESSKEAMNRIVNVVDEAFNREVENTIIVTHGNLMSLLLKNYDNSFDFDCWKNLSNPDVFVLSYVNNKINMEHLWRKKLIKK